MESPPPLLFLDVDGPLIPFGGDPGRHPEHLTARHLRAVLGEEPAHPLLTRLDPRLGPRLAALLCRPMTAQLPVDAPEFRAFLRRLVAQLEAPGADVPQVDNLLLRWAAALTDRAPEPGWPGLAAQLLDALAAPSAGSAEPAAMEHEPEVATAGELRTLLRVLAADHARARAWTEDRRSRGLWAGDGSGWAYLLLPDFLAAWESWLEDRLPAPPGRPDAERLERVEPVTWASIAWQLGAARVYE